MGRGHESPRCRGSSSFLADELRKLLLDCMRDRPWPAVGNQQHGVPAAPATAFVLVALAGRRPDARDPALEDPGCRPASPEALDSQKFIAAISKRHRLPLAAGEAAE